MKKIYRIFCLIAGSSLIASTSFAYSVGTKNSNNQSSYDLTNIPIKHPSVNFKNVLQQNDGSPVPFQTIYSAKGKNNITCTYKYPYYTPSQKKCPELKRNLNTLNIPFTINKSTIKYNLSDILFLKKPNNAMILLQGDSRNDAIMKLNPPGHLQGASVSHENIQTAVCYNIAHNLIRWDPNKASKWLPCN